MVRERKAGRDKADIIRISPQSPPAIQPEHGALRPWLSPGLRFMAWLEPHIKPLSILRSLAGIGGSHVRCGLTDVPARAPPRNQSIFICHFYWLGRGDRIAHS